MPPPRGSELHSPVIHVTTVSGHRAALECQDLALLRIAPTRAKKNGRARTADSRQSPLRPRGKIENSRELVALYALLYTFDEASPRDATFVGRPWDTDELPLHVTSPVIDSAPLENNTHHGTARERKNPHVVENTPPTGEIWTNRIHRHM